MFHKIQHLSKELLNCVKLTVFSAGFHDREGQQYCQQCFLTLFASRCQGCSQPILENYISALNSLWHPQCFVCRVSVSVWTVSKDDVCHVDRGLLDYALWCGKMKEFDPWLVVVVIDILDNI